MSSSREDIFANDERFNKTCLNLVAMQLTKQSSYCFDTQEFQIMTIATIMTNNILSGHVRIPYNI